MNLSDPNYVAALKKNIHATFDSAHGQETMAFLERLGSWMPNVMDSNETNDIIARDANRRLLGTIKTIMALSTEEIVSLSGENQ
jgi:hypothetical protein